MAHEENLIQENPLLLFHAFRILSKDLDIVKYPVNKCTSSIQLELGV